MHQFVQQGSFVQHHTLRYVAVPGSVIIVGEIACLGNIVISVEKYLEVLDDRPATDVLDGEDDAMVQTFLYSYNACVRGAANFLRYDNSHAWPGHADQHHKHRMDWRNNGRELPNSPGWVGRAGWPLLSTFIDEVAEWYWNNRPDLPSPDAVPDVYVCAPRLRVFDRF
jgi:hypothetical protein